MKVRIMCDSTADITPEVREKLAAVIPLTVNIDGKEYADGVTLTHEEFYRLLPKCEKVPTTSQPTPAAFHDLFAEAVEDGCEVVMITISSKISGTFQSATIAAKDFPGQVYVVDSKNLCIASGILVELAVRLAEEGLSAIKIAERLNRDRERLQLIAVFDTMKNLVKSGRVSKAVGLAGELLSIKPITGAEDGAVKVFGKARGRKMAESMLVCEIEKRGGPDTSMPMQLGYTGTDDSLLRQFIDHYPDLWQGRLRELRSVLVGCVVGTHAGSNAIAVAFFGAEQ